LLDPPTIQTSDDAAIARGSSHTRLPLRQALRLATAAPHARLHLHAGFAAVQAGTIERVEYRSLLARLYGFHVAFEAATDIATERSAWLQEDLATLSTAGHAPTAIPRCTALPSFETPARRLGALYVVEGSTLGGRQLARRLDPLLGATGSAGRRFFLGRGAATTDAWNAFLERVSAMADRPSVQRDIVAAAVQTFDVFEQWLRGWRTSSE
jgi:heme oxygenase